MKASVVFLEISNVYALYCTNALLSFSLSLHRRLGHVCTDRCLSWTEGRVTIMHNEQLAVGCIAQGHVNMTRTLTTDPLVHHGPLYLIIVFVCFGFRETMIQSKPEFSTSKWIPLLLPSNNGSRRWRLFGRKWRALGNLFAPCRKEASCPKMTPVSTTPTSPSVCRHQKKCWVRSMAHIDMDSPAY